MLFVLSRISAVLCFEQDQCNVVCFEQDKCIALF